MTRQASLFAPAPADTRPTRAPLLPPHATPEDMARPREVSVILLPPSHPAGGWATRPHSTPLAAMTSFIGHMGQPAALLHAFQGADPDDIEIRLTQPADRAVHIVAIVTGLTLDEARKCLAQLAAH